jgi:hypothetical protein
MVKRGGWVVSLLRAHIELGEQLAVQTDAHFAFILVHPSGEQLAEIARLCDAGSSTSSGCGVPTAEGVPGSSAQRRQACPRQAGAEHYLSRFCLPLP